jgi:3-methyladenine DNA glycosylase AlkD
METVESILKELEKMGDEQTRKTLARHGAPDHIYGVKVGDMKTIVKRVKKSHELALGLYDTGNSDAMYLAGLIGDETKMTKADLNRWAKNSTWHMISEYTVPFVAAESPLGWELAQEWINSSKENIASAGWATLSGIISTVPNEKIDSLAVKSLVQRVVKDIHQSQNRVRYTMNGFLLSVGAYIPEWTEEIKTIAKKLGVITVNMGDTACKVPSIMDYLHKMEAKNVIGKKRKSARC